MVLLNIIILKKIRQASLIAAVKDWKILKLKYFGLFLIFELFLLSLFVTPCLFSLLNIASASDESPIVIKKEIKRKMSLIDIVNLALDRALKIEQADLNIKIAEHEYKKSLAAYYPEITISDRFQSSGDSDRIDTNTPTIALSYLLYDFGGREASVKQLEYKLEAVQYDRNTNVQDFIFSVIQAYYNLFIATEDEKAAIEVEAASLSAFEAASLKYKLGLVPKTDRLKAETSYSQNKLIRQKANSTVKSAMADLNYLLRLNPDELLEFSTPEVPVDNATKDVDIEKMIEAAVAVRPEILSKKKELEAIKQNVRYTKASRYPTISAGASASRSMYLKPNDIEDENNYSYNLSISMPLFTGFKNSNEIAKAKRQLDYAKLELEDLERTIRVNVWDAYHEFITSIDTFETSKQILKSALELEKTTFGMYKNGKASMLDLIDAQSNLADAKKEFNSSKYGYFIAKAKLLRALGRNDLIGDNI